MSIEALFRPTVQPEPVLAPSDARPTQSQEAQDAYDLETAVIFSRVDALRAMLERGVPANAPGEDGYLPLSFAVVHNKPEVMRALLEHGADPLRVDQGGLCPLELAEALGHDLAIDVLLEHLGVALRSAGVDVEQNLAA